MEKEFNKKRSNSIVITIIVTVILCATLFCGLYFHVLKDLKITTTRVEKDVTITDAGIADAVDKIYDAVVVVETYRGDTLYSTGTGFVYNKEGYILTNYHVVNGGDKVSVIFTNNKKIETEIIGGDEYADIAVLKVNEKDIVSVSEIGKSDNLRVGDTTFAVGAPIDSETYSWTVTRGILSGKNRVVEVTSGRNSIVMEVLQTDAAINSGNSGGPLCNSNGEVIGVTNMKMTSESIEGMGFAIPIEIAVKYASLIIDGKQITRPYVGISMYDNTNYFGVSDGIYIESIEKDSPAEKGGLKSGDKILKVNDKEVKSSAYFKYELYKYDIGETITITVLRDKKEKQLKVVLESINELL